MPHTQSHWRRAILAVALAGILATTGCAQLARFGIGTTPIGTISQDPGSFQTVTVKGKVSNQFTLFGSGLYQVDDGTGTIWVVTQKGAPNLGADVVVQGEVNLGVNISGQNFGVSMNESSRTTF
ncbi:MAG: hypothetical protein OHK0012_23800 [Synechococcales cyanobacterium]